LISILDIFDAPTLRIHPSFGQTRKSSAIDKVCASGMLSLIRSGVCRRYYAIAHVSQGSWPCENEI
jgi:hypothetical protein